MRQDEAFKENRRPSGMAMVSNGERQQCPDLPSRRPLGERRACSNKRDVEPCIKWLQGTVARSRVVKEAPTSPPPKGPPANAPPAQPSCSPDIIRKKSSRDLEACFGLGPAMKGDVKDRRKSKPRALLTVDVHKGPVNKVPGAKGIPKPGRASLEWISDDPDDSTSESGTTGDASSGGSNSSCTVQPWETPRGTHTYGNTDVWQQAWYLKSFSSPSDTEWSNITTMSTALSSSADADTVVGAYECCHHTSHSLLLPKPSSSSEECGVGEGRGKAEEPGIQRAQVVDALHKLTLAQFEKRKCGVPSSSNNSYDSLSEQVDLFSQLQESPLIPDCYKAACLVTGLLVAAYLCHRRFHHR